MTREDAIKALNFFKNSVQSKEDTEVLNMAIKALKQEPIIDRIRAEIANYQKEAVYSDDIVMTKRMVLTIIDKYKADRQ